MTRIVLFTQGLFPYKNARLSSCFVFDKNYMVDDIDLGMKCNEQFLVQYLIKK